MGVLAIVGTRKGAFLARSDDARKNWKVEGPIFKGWKVTAASRDDRGRYFLGVSSQVYGPAIHASDDLKDWKQIEKSPKWPEGSDRKLEQIWTIHPHGDTWYAGVAVAGLFSSTDRGESWQSVEGLNEHASRKAWQPGAGGLCAHSILVDPTNPKRVWVGISAVGLFRTDDGGKTWNAKNDGVKIILEDEEFKDVGY